MIAWYNENQLRDWPFVAGSDIPREIVADMGLTSNANGDGTSGCLLNLVERLTSAVRLTFRIHAGLTVTFTIPDGTPEYSTIWSDRPNPVAAFDTCATPESVVGFLVLGSLPSLHALVPSVGSRYETLNYLEPAVVDLIETRHVQSISLGNASRRLSPAFAQCDAEPYTRPANYRIPARNGDGYTSVAMDFECIRGDISLKPGYSCDIAQSDSAKSFTISAVEDADMGVACEEIALDATEQAILASGQTISGLQNCSDIVKAINGVGGPHLVIKGRNGVEVVTTAEPAIVIKLSSESSNNCGLP